VFEKVIAPILQEWFQEERGNRVTSNNMQMLFNKIAAAMPPLKKEKAGTIPPGNKEKEK
jgi:hypothetical protein